MVYYLYTRKDCFGRESEETEGFVCVVTWKKIHLVEAHAWKDSFQFILTKKEHGEEKENRIKILDPFLVFLISIFFPRT